MPITTVPPFPLRSQGLTQQAYSAGVEASLSAIPLAITDLNAVGSAYALATNGTSVSSVLIGTGSKSFTTQTGLGYQVGMTLRIANNSVNYMTGDVTSYNSSTGALVINITSVAGSGTFTVWTISMAAVGANSAGSISFIPAGNITASNVQSAIQELDTEKLSNAAGSVTGTNLEDIITGGVIGGITAIPVITYDANGRITAVSSVSNYPCRAWVNFNGTGTVAIRASGNVSSITDNSTGDYTVNFITAMPDANYSVVGTTLGQTTSNVTGIVVVAGTIGTGATTKSTSALRINTGSSSTGVLQDSADNSISIFR